MTEFLYKPRSYKNIELFKHVTDKQWNNYEWQLKNTIRSIDQLKKVITLHPYQEEEIRRTFNSMKSEGKDPLRITPYYASLMQSDVFNPQFLTGEKSYKRLDPIFWQSVPTPANLLFPNAGKEASMNEEVRSYGSAYQRYPNRVALFVAVNTSCASYCIHCQRSKSLDTSVDVNMEQIEKGLFYIRYNTNIDEVLLTGGDALMINRNLLFYLIKELSRIKHLRVIRIASRVPVVLPMAISSEFLQEIKNTLKEYSSGIEKYVYFMTHINHYHEITEDMYKVSKLIRDNGFTIRNQTVLLNHVNDYYLTLAETFRRMFWIGIHPYYLLQCHKERGIIHFITPVQIGKIYMKHLQGWLSGIVKPSYAANIEGGGGKVLLMPSGHDTLNNNHEIDNDISPSFAKVNTWDNRKIYEYEALGRATIEEYNEAVNIMDKFIGRKGVFLPKVLLFDGNNYIKTTNRSKLPRFSNTKKSALLGYEILKDDLPITNPNDIKSELDKLYYSEVKK